MIMSFRDKRQCCIVERVHVGFGGNDFLKHGSVTSCQALVKVKDPAEPQRLYHRWAFGAEYPIRTVWSEQDNVYKAPGAAILSVC